MYGCMDTYTHIHVHRNMYTHTHIHGTKLRAETQLPLSCCASCPEVLLLMDKILHDLKDSKLWELWYIPYNG